MSGERINIERPVPRLLAMTVRRKGVFMGDWSITAREGTIENTKLKEKC